MEEKKKSAAKDLVVGTLLVAFGIYVVIDSLCMKVYNTFIDAPGFFPLIIGVVRAVLGAIQAVLGFRAGGVKELKEVCTSGYLLNFIRNDRTVRVLILLGMMAVYVYVLIGWLPFVAATSIYLTANFLYLKACKHWWNAILIAVVASFAVYYAFRFGFKITMP